MDTAKCDYLLLFRGSHWSEHLSPEQVQQVVSDWYDWFEGVKAEGKCTDELMHRQVNYLNNVVEADRGKLN